MQRDNENLFEFYSLMRLQIFSQQKIHVNTVETIIRSSFSVHILETFSGTQKTPVQIWILEKPLLCNVTYSVELQCRNNLLKSILKDGIRNMEAELYVCVYVCGKTTARVWL